MKKLTNIKDIEKFLIKYIPRTIEGNFFSGKGLDRVKYFAKLLNNPQEKIKNIHIAGTSGKGSTATIISNALHGLGFEVGLQLSPHLLDIRERCQINNELLEEKEFVKYFNELIPVIQRMGKSNFGNPTYFEIMTILAWYIFYKKDMDYAIIETGLGGLYDATNIVKNENKIVALTKIGKDHTEILGKTIKEISKQKAGIIQKNNIVFSMQQKSAATKVIKIIARNNNSKIFYTFNNCKFDLGLKGSFQKENCTLALKVVNFLSDRDNFQLDKQTVQKALLKIKFPGRFEKKQFGDKVVIFDGAHNVQKITAFVKSLKQEFPNKKFDFLVAFKFKKDFNGILQKIVPVAESATITNFQDIKRDLGISAEAPTKVTHILDKLNYTNYKVIFDSRKAFKKCIQKQDRNILVVTGSLYLIAEIYKNYDKK